MCYVRFIAKVSFFCSEQYSSTFSYLPCSSHSVVTLFKEDQLLEFMDYVFVQSYFVIFRVIPFWTSTLWAVLLGKCGRSGLHAVRLTYNNTQYRGNVSKWMFFWSLKTWKISFHWYETRAADIRLTPSLPVPWQWPMTHQSVTTVRCLQIFRVNLMGEPIPEYVCFKHVEKTGFLRDENRTAPQKWWFLLCKRLPFAAI